MIGNGGGSKKWEWVVVELDVEVIVGLVVELLDILICILGMVMSKRVIFEVTVWGDQLTGLVRNRTYVLVFTTPGL